METANTRTRVIAVLTTGIVEKLDRVAEQRVTSRSEVIRLACNELLQREERRQRQTGEHSRSTANA